ncbi:MAG: aspartyl protease family protein [Lentimicrobiaceae bacterium]|nr:aspartyl protease family protein [Lentimicrobiaceae bacterium]
MNKTIALYTNVLVYCHSNDEVDKQEIATSLFAFYPVISTQVLSEYLNVVKRTLKLPKDEIMDICLKTFILLLAILLAACTSKTNPSAEQQSNPLVERKLLLMLDNQDMFRLEACLKNERTEISQGIALFLEAHLQNAFNQTEQSLQTIDLLFDKYENSLNDTLSWKIYKLKADNLVKQYQYCASVEAMKKAIDKYAHAADSLDFANMIDSYNTFEPLREVLPQKIHITTDVTIPISRNLMFNHLLVPVTSGGESENFVFDTGASLSVVTESCAKRLGIRVLESSLEVENILGVKIQSKVGVSDSLWIGNLLVKNVVFLVLADEFLFFKDFDYTIYGIIGFPIMYQMKEIKINKDKSIIVSGNPQKRDLHNLFFDGSTMLVQAEADSDTVLLFIDSGTNSSFFSERYFKAHQDKIQEKAKLYNLKRGGAGSTSIISKHYVLENISFMTGGYELTLPSIFVTQEKIKSFENYDGYIGADVLMYFNTLILNFEDMYLTFEE